MAWLFAGETAVLSVAARRALERGELIASPAVLLELQYLYETNRTSEPAERVIEDLRERLSLRICDLAFADVVRRAIDQNWTRDPFDRLIVAQAMVRGATLVTKDAQIRAHYRRAVW